MNNKTAVITAFLGGVKNRYMQYHPDRSIEEKFELAKKIKGLDGLELCYPGDFADPTLLTDKPALIAGLIPLWNNAVSKKI